MADTNKRSSGFEEMQHNGELLKKYADESPLNRTRIAERMGVTPSMLANYYGRQTLQTNVLWKASLALDHNFLFDLAVRLPVDFVTERETELQKENERLKIELSVYEKIVKK